MVKIEARLSANEEYLERAKAKSLKPKEKQRSFARCGAPYFKDAHGDPAPLNQDYKYRKNVLKEFFPYDLPQNPARWKMREKVSLVNGIKNQMIDHIKVEQSKKLCQDRNTRQRIVKLKFISNNDELSKSTVLEVYQEIQENYPTFKISWSNISFDILNSSHSITECMGIWYSYLRPDLNRSRFTDQENTDMMIAISKNNHQNWDEVARHCDRRSSMQCFIHYHKAITRLFEYAEPFSQEEDDILMKAIEKNTFCGASNWNKIAEAMRNRTKLQCYNRYICFSREQPLKRGNFSREEDMIILDYVEKNGKKFNEILKLLPERTVTQIRNHYNLALASEGESHCWTPEEDAALIEFVNTYGTNNWKDIANTLKTHNRLSCRTRYGTIQKYLSKNPNASLESVPKKHKKVNAFIKAKDIIPTIVPRSAGVNTQVLEKFKKSNSKLYHLFKTCFNYDLGRRIPSLNDQNVMINVLNMLLKIDWSGFVSQKQIFYTEVQKLVLKQAENYKLDGKLVQEISAVIPFQFLMPPNWNTVVGIRAIAIKNHLKDQEPETRVIDTKCTDLNYNKSLNEFNKLFFSLFYWSAMVSKIDSDELKGLYNKKNPQNYTAVDFINNLRSNDKTSVKKMRLTSPQKFKGKLTPKS